MIAKVISKYGLAAHLGILAAFPVACAPFLDEFSLGCALLWLSLLAGVWIFAEPSMRAGEHSADARRRNLVAIACDPIFYFFLLAILFAGVRALNSGIDLAYDPEQALWQVKDPALPVFPASVAPHGFLPFVASLALGVFVIGVRHALGLKARLFCGLTVVTLVGAGGLFAAFGLILGYFPDFAKVASGSFADVPWQGVAYGFFLLLSVAFGCDAESKMWRAARLPFVLAVSGSATGLVFFAPPVVGTAFLLPLVPFFIFSVIHLAHVGSKGGCARMIVFFLLAMSVPALLMMGGATPALREAKVAALDFEHLLPAGYATLLESLRRIARDMWLKSPWLGVGVGAFPLQVPFLAASGDWTILPPHPVSAVNGFWTLLAERGILGCACLAIGFGFFVWSWFARLVEAFLFLRHQTDSEIFIFACPPVVWLFPVYVLLALGVIYLTPAFAAVSAVFAFVIPLALSAASFPRNPHAAASDDAASTSEGK